MATRGSTPRTRAKGGDAALDRLGGSIEAAQEALKDLRGELSKGGRDLLKDLEVLLRDARKNLRGAQRTLVKDLEEMQKAAAGKRRTAATRAPAKRTTASKRGGAASARKTTGRATRATRETQAREPRDRGQGRASLLAAAFENPRLRRVGHSRAIADAPRRLRMLARIADVPDAPRPVASRVVQPTDGRAQGLLAFAAYRGTIDDHGETAEDHVEELTATLSGRYGRVLLPASGVVARAHGDLAAGALFTQWDELPFLAFCLTHPHWQGRGLATGLIACGARALAADGHREMHLAVSDGNRATALYQRLGFREVPIPRQ